MKYNKTIFIFICICNVFVVYCADSVPNVYKWEVNKVYIYSYKAKYCGVFSKEISKERYYVLAKDSNDYLIAQERIPTQKDEFKNTINGYFPKLIKFYRVNGNGKLLEVKYSNFKYVPDEKNVIFLPMMTSNLGRDITPFTFDLSELEGNAVKKDNSTIEYKYERKLGTDRIETYNIYYDIPNARISQIIISNAIVASLDEVKDFDDACKSEMNNAYSKAMPYGLMLMKIFCLPIIENDILSKNEKAMRNVYAILSYLNCNNNQMLEIINELLDKNQYDLAFTLISAGLEKRSVDYIKYFFNLPEDIYNKFFDNKDWDYTDGLTKISGYSFMNKPHEAKIWYGRITKVFPNLTDSDVETLKKYLTDKDEYLRMFSLTNLEFALSDRLSYLECCIDVLTDENDKIKDYACSKLVSESEQYFCYDVNKWKEWIERIRKFQKGNPEMDFHAGLKNEDPYVRLYCLVKCYEYCSKNLKIEEGIKIFTEASNDQDASVSKYASDILKKLKNRESLIPQGATH